MSLVSAICPVCRTSGAFLEVERSEPYTILQCPSCGLGFSDKMTYRAELYESAYRSSADADTCRQTGGVDYRGYLGSAPALIRKRRSFRISFFRWIVLSPAQRAALAWLRSELPPGARVLDVGFGTGLFMAALRSFGFAPIGLDVAGEACERLRASGFEAYRGSVPDYPKQVAPPAAVTFFEVLEHLDDPVEFLRGLAAAFPGAPIVFSVPSPSRASLLRGREAWDYPPHHLTRWSEKAIPIALESAGYRPVSIRFPPPEPSDFTGSGLGRLLEGCGGPPAVAPRSPAGAEERGASSGLSRMALLWLGKAMLFSPLIVLRRMQGYSATSMVVMAMPALAPNPAARPEPMASAPP